jgi:hypothetical protein
MCNRGVTISYIVTISGRINLRDDEVAEEVARHYESHPYELLEFNPTIDGVTVEVD